MVFSQILPTIGLVLATFGTLLNFFSHRDDNTYPEYELTCPLPEALVCNFVFNMTPEVTVRTPRKLEKRDRFGVINTGGDIPQTAAVKLLKVQPVCHAYDFIIYPEFEKDSLSRNAYPESINDLRRPAQCKDIHAYIKSEESLPEIRRNISHESSAEFVVNSTYSSVTETCPAPKVGPVRKNDSDIMMSNCFFFADVSRRLSSKTVIFQGNGNIFSNSHRYCVISRLVGCWILNSINFIITKNYSYPASSSCFYLNRLRNTTKVPQTDFNEDRFTESTRDRCNIEKAVVACMLLTSLPFHIATCILWNFIRVLTK